jgi:FixJ family two-component response regulator
VDESAGWLTFPGCDLIVSELESGVPCSRAVAAISRVLAAASALARPYVDSSRRLQEAKIATPRERFESLTPREREVLALVVSGRPNKQIASEIGTSETIAKVHRGQLMRKMGADSLADLVRMAEKIGIPTTKS